MSRRAVVPPHDPYFIYAVAIILRHRHPNHCEETTEVATVGAVRILHDTQELFQRYYHHDKNTTGTSTTSTTTNAIHVPTNAQWYGGARFDPKFKTSMVDDHDLSNTAYNEWSDFDRMPTDRTTASSLSATTTGAAYWMLPAVELLVTHRVHPREDRPEASRPMATLAIHLVATKDTNYDWNTAAREVRDILNDLTAECANQIPPTTLPPILERGNPHPRPYPPNHNGYQYLKRRHRHHNQDDDEMEYRKDDQEFYEEAVAQALKELQPLTVSTQQPPLLDSSRNETSIGKYNAAHQNSTLVMAAHIEESTGTEQPPHHDALEKVVLARKQCLHFGTTFTALDVIRRWKYGGHEGGHLFYMRPG